LRLRWIVLRRSHTHHCGSSGIENMPDESIEDLRDANLALRSALQTALLFAEEVAMGNHGSAEAAALVSVLREALEPGERQR
jgi:hypothetical protein